MKYLAISIGPHGLGVFGLISSFFTFLGAILYSWLNSMVTKFVAGSADMESAEQTGLIITISMGVCLFSSLIGILPIIIFSGFVRDTFLTKEISALLIVLYAVAFLFTGFNSQLNSYLLGLQHFSKMAHTRIASSLVDLICVALFVYLWGLTGFFLSLIASALFTSIILLRISSPNIVLNISVIHRSSKLLYRMIVFSGTNFFLGITYLGSFYLLRKIIVGNLGLDNLGLFFAAFGFASQMGILAQGMNYYSLTELAKDRSPEQKLDAVNDYLYLALVCVTPLCMIAILFQNIVTSLFYSKAFAPMGTFFYLLIVAQFFASITCIFDVVLWTAEKNREHAIVTVTSTVGGLTLAWALLQSYGLAGVGLGLLAALLVSQMLSYCFVKQFLDFRFRSNVFRLLVVSVLIIAGSVLVRNVRIEAKASFASLSFLSLFLFVEKRHVQIAKRKFFEVVCR